MIEVLVMCICLYCAYLGCKQDLEAQRITPQRTPPNRVASHGKNTKTEQPPTCQVLHEEREEPQLPSYSEVTRPNRTSHP